MIARFMKSPITSVVIRLECRFPLLSLTVVFVTNYRYHISPSKSRSNEHQSTECEIMEIDSEVKYLKKLNTIITILKSRFMLHIPLHIKSIIV